MKTKKQILIAFLLASCFSPLIFAQQEQKELSIEESFLQEPIQIQIIREQSESIDRSGKIFALDLIKEYLDSGNKSAAILSVLRRLSLEGTLNRERIEGRVGNNYIDVRWRAAEYLGEFTPEESGNYLRDIILNEEEPSVIISAINSITKLGIYDEFTMLAIEKAFRRIDAIRPDDRLALSVLEYYKKPEKKSRFMLETINYIRQSPNYQKSVRLQAENLIKIFMSQNIN
ncbi:MAG: HEAT repeat domain-containing protein [Spirochaetaceae bacterium]|nr:HEAT repeat domain-containing protein [Spirochaetaceae bacterium]